MLPELFVTIRLLFSQKRPDIELVKQLLSKPKVVSSREGGKRKMGSELISS